MRFLTHQNQARVNTTRLVVLFSLAIVAVVASIAIGIPALIVAGTNGEANAVTWRDVAPMAMWLGIGTLAAILIAVAVRSSQLRSGGGAYVAESLGGTKVSPETRDLKERQLLHVVEEMAIAAGIPVPTVYVLQNEPGINAFAAGNSPSESVIGVTRGALDAFTRDELQGVIGHEFSHICEEDMSISMRLMAWIFGVAVLSVIGMVIFRIALNIGYFGGGSRRDNKEGNSTFAVVMFLLLCGVIVWIVGIVGQIFGNLIQAAISRQREFLADASAVKFTRNPDGIASALRKIAVMSQHGRIRSGHSEMSYLFFSASMSSLMATHPPIEERIRRIEGEQGVRQLHEMERTPPRDPQTAETGTPTQPAESGLERLRRIPGMRIPRGGAEGASERLISGVTAGLVGTHLADTQGPPERPGSPERPSVASREPTLRSQKMDGTDRDDLRRAAILCDSLPPELVAASRDTWAARGVVLAILLPEEPSAAQKQLAVARHAKGVPVATIQGIATMIQTLPDDAKVALIDLTLRTLRTMSATQGLDFLSLLEEYVEADGRISLMEGMFVVLMRNILNINGIRGNAGRVSSRGRKATQAERQMAAETFLGILAYQGNESQSDTEQAFADGAAVLRTLYPTTSQTLPAADRCGLKSLYGALMVLQQGGVQERSVVLQATIETINADGKVTLREAILLRMVGAVLGLPVPTMLPDG